MGSHPFNGLERFLHHALGLGPARVVVRALRARALLGVRRDAGSGCVADEHQRVRQLLGEMIDPTRFGLRHRVTERVRRVAEIIGLIAIHPALRPPRGPLDLRDAEFIGGRLCHPRGEFVCLVDDDRVVIRDHRDALDGVDREEGVIRHDEL